MTSGFELEGERRDTGEVVERRWRGATSSFSMITMEEEEKRDEGRRREGRESASRVERGRNWRSVMMVRKGRFAAGARGLLEGDARSSFVESGEGVLAKLLLREAQGWRRQGR